MPLTTGSFLLTSVVNRHGKVDIVALFHFINVNTKQSFTHKTSITHCAYRYTETYTFEFRFKVEESIDYRSRGSVSIPQLSTRRLQ